MIDITKNRHITHLRHAQEEMSGINLLSYNKLKILLIIYVLVAKEITVITMFAIQQGITKDFLCFHSSSSISQVLFHNFAFSILNFSKIFSLLKIFSVNQCNNIASTFYNLKLCSSLYSIIKS